MCIQTGSAAGLIAGLAILLTAGAAMFILAAVLASKGREYGWAVMIGVLSILLVILSLAMILPGITSPWPIAAMIILTMIFIAVMVLIII